MQGKGFIKTLAIVLGLICLSYLSHTAYVQWMESKACELSSDGSDAEIEKQLAILGKDTLNLGITKYNYYDSKKKEMNLGLDLKGGMNVMLQISVKDLLLKLADNSEEATFRQALKNTDELTKNSSEGYTTLFFEEFAKLKTAQSGKPNLADYNIFGNRNNVETIPTSLTDAETEKVIQENVEASIATAYEVFRTRIDRFGVAQPNIQRIPGTGRILVELPGAKNKDRITKLLQTSAQLQFWKVDNSAAISSYISQISTDTIKTNNLISLLNITKVRSGEIGAGGGLGAARVVDTAKVNALLKSPLAKSKLPNNLKYTKFLWASKPEADSPDYLGLFAIESNKKNEPLLQDAVNEASFRTNEKGQVEVNMGMDNAGAIAWKEITTKYRATQTARHQIAIILDDLVYSAPSINEPIPTGSSSITGNFTTDEAKDLVDALKSGKLPASAKIVQADVVGPSLGHDSIMAGMYSFLVAFLCILVWMVFYYGRAGWYANLALIINMFFIIGILAALKAVLTLPGIAGLVLTLGIAVDANIITYERVKEELKKGKTIAEAYRDGWKHALSAIIDGNVTTGITAVILMLFGSGPIEGFAVTLLIGIISTLFTALLLSRVFIEARLDKGKDISFWTSITKKWFENVSFDWMGKRKIAYIISAILTIVGIISLSTKGLNLGVDFKGGKSYTVKFEKTVDPTDIKNTLEVAFPQEEGTPTTFDVKTFGDDNQVKITTKYKYDDEGVNVDNEIDNLMFTTLKNHFPANYTLKDYKNGEGFGVMSYSKVGPTIADDIQQKGFLAVGLALLGIFLYILFRFRKWQFSAGAVSALFHDSLIVLTAFSLLSGILPFSLEMDQAFIAAILTVIGYSINDTVIVFDRIRENLKEHAAMPLKELVNLSINQTLGRTFNTSATTLFVILIIFLFGGENLRGFMFALLVGIGVGTYSSVYVASAIMYDFLKKDKEITQ